MADFTEITGYPFIDIIIEALRVDFLGSTELMALTAMCAVMVILMLIGARREAVLLIPYPILLATAQIGATPGWFRIATLMAAGVYTMIIIWTIVKRP